MDYYDKQLDMIAIFLLGRLITGGYFIYNAYNHFKNRNSLMHYAKAKGVPAPKAAVIGTGVMLLLGGLSILLGFEMIIGMSILVLFLLPTTFMMHQFWKEKDATVRMGEQINFTKNLAMAGMLLMMIAMVFVFL